jgi:dolichol-phosphate mannosyltransferase
MNGLVAVVIPAYKVKKHILSLIDSIGDEVSRIYLIDDKCPQETGKYVLTNCIDERVEVIFNKINLGVGGAVMEGYKRAVADGMEIIVKIDGDNQMDPRLIPFFIGPIIRGEADYTKGNRFYDLEGLRSMPGLRIFGNAILSLMTKLSSGYWNLFDPTNGYTAIHRGVINHLPFSKISNRYFFETDLLFRLYILRAKIIDIPMEAVYEDEISNLKISKILGEFLIKHMRNFVKRIFYCYYLRDLSLASIEFPIGIALFLFGALFGAWNWGLAYYSGTTTAAGTIMLSALPILMGLQLILSFLSYDIGMVPKDAIHPLLISKDQN